MYSCSQSIEYFRRKQDFEKEILQRIERTTKVINHSIINQDALILATAEKEDVDLGKYKEQILRDIQGQLYWSF